MKVALWIIGVLFGLVLVVFGLQILASERVEVVELHTIDEAGQPQTTRLWIVDHDGFQYLRGDTASGWYKRIQANGEFELTRNDTRSAYKAALRQDKVDVINELFHDKYTWGDEFIELLIGGREGALAIELQPTAADG